MKIRLFNLVIIVFIFMGFWAAFAEESVSPLITYKSNRLTLICPVDINLKKLEARLRTRWFTVSAVEKDLSTNPCYSIEKRILARLESILLRVEQILAMDVSNMQIKIKVFGNRKELNNEYARMYGTIENYRSFYIHSYGTIYTSMQDVSDSKIAHEMAHAVIDNYFRIIPPERTAELLATYVDSHLERE